MAKPRILLFDIETAPNIATSHQLYERRGLTIPYQGILQERYIFCASWKWLGEKKIYSSCIDARPLFPLRDDRDFPVVQKLHAVVSEADAIVAHNGDGFDVPWLRTRAVFYGMKPLPPVIQIDTRKIAAKVFRFNTNRLDYLGAYLGVGKKIKTDYELWMRCLMGEKGALAEMVRYNKCDVYPLLELVYKKLAPHVPSTVNRALFGAGTECPNCGGHDLKSNGFRYMQTTKYRRMQCLDCGHWSREPMSGKGIVRS